MNHIYEWAKQVYLDRGIDVEKALFELGNIPLSIHCWQGDDVLGFDGSDKLEGGIQATGNYPYKARNFAELTQDLHEAFSLMPGKKRLNLHASYALLSSSKKIDRDNYTIEEFKPWIEFAKKEKLDGIDFNPTCFSHPMVKEGFTLSSNDEKVRSFWVRHCQACIKIAEAFAKEFNSYSLVNIWIPDGLKDIPGNRLNPRLRLKKSLDEILSIPYDKSKVYISLESKVFGIGMESYTVGSAEFMQSYAISHNLPCLLDNGHFHPNENVADKISSLLSFSSVLALHLTRGVRWDSDHVTLFDDTLKELCEEVVKYNHQGKILLGLDYFDASINRISAWVTGQRAVQKALLYALLLPLDKLTQYQEQGEMTKLMFERQLANESPWNIVWEEYLNRNGTSQDYISEIEKYEREVLSLRKGC